MADDSRAQQAGSPESRLKAELEAANNRVSQLYTMASLGRLLVGVVHEINTHIGSIFSKNEVMVRSLEKILGLLREAEAASAPPPAKALQLLETIQSLASVDKIACERISSVIRSLKTCSRVDEADVKKVDIQDILRDALKLSATQFRGRVAVETEFGDVPEVECFPHLLSQVFINLLINAGQAIEGEGKVTVRTRLEEDEVCVSISDTGGGIKPENQARIFIPGFTTKPAGVGTGLGLPISREIVVKVHGGRMDFESQEGAGTTFHVRIPLQRREVACC